MRPDPVSSPENQFFWDALNRNELQIQQCAQCQIFLHPPRPMCPQCYSLKHKHVSVDGKAVLYCWCLPRHPKIPMFEYPLITALVDLACGVRLLSNLVECDTRNLRPGMDLEICFVQTVGGKTIHQFRPIQANPENTHV
ncbi:Zn-ribbon domain-containing OB-fold protein [Microbulbifer spongiae]|uniref:Zn-ribbon domain-containing OB-fold protein n=1 Tax=Microbulbifer spongiae TaxID=2944933 RepID=UPI00345EF6C1